jgi:hypothetical protein
MRDEHDRIIAEVRNLAREAREHGGQPPNGLTERAAKVASLLGDHEEREHRLAGLAAGTMAARG